MGSIWSLFVQIMAVIVLVTIFLTLIIGVFSYVGYKVRQGRTPEADTQVADFFWRYSPQSMAPMNRRPSQSLPAGRAMVVADSQAPYDGGGAEQRFYTGQ